MGLDFITKVAVGKLAETLYDFLPASGNGNTSFPIAAAKIGLSKYWEHNSKLPAIKSFIEIILFAESNKLVPFLEEVVQQSITWRGSGERALRRSEVDELNSRLLSLGYKSEQLTNLEFLSLLQGNDTGTENRAATQPNLSISIYDRERLLNSLMETGKLEPQPRGFAFERFLNALFGAYGLNPHKSFRLAGEQVDGSFDCASSTYLLEAKWVAKQVDQAQLLVFKGKVDGKSAWSRGLFISINGYSHDGLQSFLIGKSTNIICMDGLDLHTVLSGAIDLKDAIERKARRAAETNRAFVPLGELL